MACVVKILFQMQETRDQVLADIRKPGQRESLRKVSASDATRPAPPRKALPTMPIDARQKVQTWGGSKPAKPLPKLPIPEAPKRPSDSPSLRKGWDGQKSVNSAFIERSKSPLTEGKPSMSDSPRPPKKPLPSFPDSNSNGTMSTNVSQVL